MYKSTIMSENNYSLVAMLRNDPDFSERLAHVKKKVENDKVIIKKATETYTQKHELEIAEGTKKMQLLLTEGTANGLTEEEIKSQYGKFLPTVRTPILNMLYFILRESEEIDRDLYQRRDMAQKNNKYIGFEEEKAFEIHVAVPGVAKEDFKIDVNDNVLTISGERKFTKEKKETNYHSVETQFGAFKRAFTLPENVDATSITAKYNNGILEVVVPKDEKKVLKTSIKVN
jgi:HSP20 family molecular chaperone IbpA